MVTVTGLTAARMIAMENATVIDGEIEGSDLVLITRDGTHINAGSVLGPVGPPGTTFTVCTSTTRPTPGSTEAGLAIYETDTRLIRIWTGTRWRIQERVITTNPLRPTGLDANDEGVRIYEADTNSEWVWSGSGWVPPQTMPSFTNPAARDAAWPSPPPGAMCHLTSDPGWPYFYNGTAWKSPWPRGIIASSFFTVDQAIPPAWVGYGDIAGSNVSVTIPANRVIRVEAEAAFMSVPGATQMNAVMGLFQLDNVGLRERYGSMVQDGGGTTVPLRYTYQPVPSAGTYGWKLRHYASNTGGYFQEGSIQVVDMGSV